MGLVKRGETWWMSFMYEGRQVRRSTRTSDKRLAEAILGKIQSHKLSRDVSLRSRKRNHLTFEELMERYLTEHAAQRANRPRELTSVRTLKAFFGNPQLVSDELRSGSWPTRINAIPTESSQRRSIGSSPR